MVIKTIFVLSIITINSFLMAKSYAVVVGINGVNLKVAAKDAKNIKNMLRDFGIRDIKILLNDNATKSAIISAIERVNRNIQENDWVYFFFSGHGTSEYDPSVEHNKTLKKRLKDTGALISSDNKLIVIKESLAKIFKDFDDKKVNTVIIFDTCFSGNSYKDSFITKKIEPLPLYTSTFTTKKEYPYKNIRYLAATSANDYAVEKDENGSYFTLSLIKCFKEYRVKRLKKLKECIQKQDIPQTPVFLPNRDMTIFPN